MIGDRIKELRKKANMTQQELASQLGKTPSAIGMYEQNRREPQYDLILQLSKLFAVTSDYLLFGNEQSLASDVGYNANVGDFDTIMNNLKDQLAMQNGLMFKGKPLSDDDLEKVFSAMKIGAEVALNSRK